MQLRKHKSISFFLSRIFAFAIFALFFVLPSFAFADFSIGTNSGGALENPGGFTVPSYSYRDGAGISTGVITDTYYSVKLWESNHSSDNTCIYLFINEVATSLSANYSTHTQVAQSDNCFQSTSTNSETFRTFEFSAGIALNSAKLYYFYIDKDVSANVDTAIRFGLSSYTTGGTSAIDVLYTVSTGNHFISLSKNYYMEFVSTQTPSLIINTPINLSTVSDFQTWVVSWNNQPSGNKQIGVKYSDNLAKLEECETFPYGGGAGYTECINGSPNIFADYGIVISSINGVNASIQKNNGLVTGTTYYAQFALQENDGFGNNIAVSDIISFTVGVPSGDIPLVTSCSTFDIFCYLKNFAIWAFIPTSASLNQFATLTLENSLPFSYLYDMPVLYNDLFGQSSPALSISIPFLNGNITLISSTMLDNIPFKNTLYSILTGLLYIGTAMAIRRKILSIHSTTH